MADEPQSGFDGKQGSLSILYDFNSLAQHTPLFSDVEYFAIGLPIHFRDSL